MPTVYNSCFQLDSIGGPCPQRSDNDENKPDEDEDEANACACDASVARYFRFIQIYDTHYTTQVAMGGEIAHRVEIKESDVPILEKNKGRHQVWGLVEGVLQRPRWISVSFGVCQRIAE